MVKNTDDFMMGLLLTIAFSNKDFFAFLDKWPEYWEEEKDNRNCILEQLVCEGFDL